MEPWLQGLAWSVPGGRKGFVDAISIVRHDSTAPEIPNKEAPKQRAPTLNPGSQGIGYGKCTCEEAVAF